MYSNTSTLKISTIEKEYQRTFGCISLDVIDAYSLSFLEFELEYYV